MYLTLVSVYRLKRSWRYSEIGTAGMSETSILPQSKNQMTKYKATSCRRALIQLLDHHLIRL